jgi:hypothetical protein
VFFPFGTLPVRGSLATIDSQARNAASSKSGASTGSTCQPVTFFPSTPIDRMILDANNHHTVDAPEPWSSGSAASRAMSR